MSMKIFSIRKTQSPDIVFCGDNFAKSVVEGLERFGPWDLGKRLFNTIRLIIVYPEKNERVTYDLIDYLIRESNLLRVSLEVISRISYIPGSMASYNKGIKEIKEIVGRERVRNNIAILQLIYEREDQHESFYNLLKSKIYLDKDTKELSVQALMIPKWIDSRDKINYSRNLLLSIYSKMGGIPWILKHPASKLLNKAYFIGYSSMEKDNKLYAMYAIFNSMGKEVIYRIIETSDLNDESVRNFWYEVFSESINRVRDSDLVVLHRYGKITSIEKEVIKDIVDNCYNKGYLYIIEFPFDWSIPIILKRNSNVLNAEPGCWFYGGIIDDLPSFFIRLFSFNKKSNLVINAVRYGVLIQTPRILERFNWSALSEDIAYQVFSLSRLNWGNIKSYFDVPITIHFMRKMRSFIERDIVIYSTTRGIFI